MDISNLQFWDKNPRLIKAENLEKLKKSIQDDPEFLAKRKILVNDTKDWMIVYAGNQRLRSLLALGYTEVPDEWIDVEKNIPIKLMEKRAFKDNVEYGEYDHDKLKDFDLEFLKELDLPEWELDLSELNDIELDEDKEDSIPEPAKVAKLIEIGDIIQLWPHRIMCGDSTNPQNIDTLIDWNKIDMVFTDPPYWIGEKWDRSKRMWKKSLMEWQFYNDFNDDTIQYAIDAYNLCETLWIEIQVWRWANYYCHSLPQSNNWLVRDKRVEDKQKDLNSDCELAWIKWPNNSVRIFRHLRKWLIKASEHWQKRVHPTQKPVELWVWCFNSYNSEGLSTLDLFLGSWSTLIACEKTNRVCYGMELDCVYIEVIIKRYREYTKWKRDIKCLNRDIDLSVLRDE